MERQIARLDFVKCMTGGDTIVARDLYSTNISFKPHFILVLQCNEKPRLAKVDKAIEGRLKIINYPYNFFDVPRLQNERKKDNRLKMEFVKPSFITNLF